MASSSKLGFLTTKRARYGVRPCPTRVKNKTPAAIQILGEARERQEPEILRPPKQKKKKKKITDSAEDYRLRKGKEFEDFIRWNTTSVVCVKYDQWEESQKDFSRARSVWERALKADYRNPSLWLKYAEFEMRNRFINHARNVWDRAVSLLPRIDQLWYKYVHMEEMLANVPAARLVFERWMESQPDQLQGWLSYIKFELRHGEVDRARSIYERFVRCHPTPSAWIRYAKFEMNNSEVARCRAVYERAVVDILSQEEEEDSEELFVAFAEFEERCCKVTERAPALYRYALEHLPKERAEDLYRIFVAYKKRYGDREWIEDAIVSKTSKTRFQQYEEEVKKNPLNYDTWFDYIRLEESVGRKVMVQEVYERAIANVPPVEEKRYWQRYICLWINYALYLEFDAGDMDRTKNVYRACLQLIPHKKFSFAKIWLMAAQFEIRQKNLKVARQILGNAIGMAPKDKIFKKYIEIELQLGNFDRCRTLYEKFLEWAPANYNAWRKYAELEKSLCEIDRARGIFELAIAQPALDIPELLWKAYIDFEISEGEFERTRLLYERLLDRTKHLKVWSSYAKFEATAVVLEDSEVQQKDEEDQQRERVQRCRGVFERAFDYYRTAAPELKEERAMLLEEWLTVESSFGIVGDIDVVKKKLPRKVKRKRAISSEDGTPSGYEEYMDYIFPDDEVTMVPNLKIPEAAYKWKKHKTASDEDCFGRGLTKNLF